jgi:hypothetical protein
MEPASSFADLSLVARSETGLEQAPPATSGTPAASLSQPDPDAMDLEIPGLDGRDDSEWEYEYDPAETEARAAALIKLK